jgi:L-ascorbate metabolism protein UlaG (beta-lactamase superfamily)
MTLALAAQPFSGSLAERLASPPSFEPALYWLGQAGFVLELSGRRLVIDPYLSDSLAEKYKGTARPHRRMMPPPIPPEALIGVDAVLCTHAHTDHMDPATLKPLLAANPDAKFVAPRAVLTQAMERSGRPAERILAVDAGERLELFPRLMLTPTRAAHEALVMDEAGHHRFLGYVLETAGLSIWHSGDCIPFAGLTEEVSALAPDIALLPVNGRRPELSQNGVPGNFTLDEAVAVAGAVGAKSLIAHHYGLFDFNTEDPAAIDAMAERVTALRLFRARTGTVYGPALP